jgi:predicted metal-dependent phosphoesterase TrpH
MHIDLHTHTTASDGSLTPRELLAYAQRRGVRVLSVTDHDSVAAYGELAGPAAGLRLVPGIEFSTQWRGREIHIVGLNIRLDDPGLQQGVAEQQRARLARAERIAARLEKLGVPEALAAAQAIAGRRAVGRPHFARHLVNTGRARDLGAAFRKYLAAGRPGYARPAWAEPGRVITWIHAAGGTAVLAHPAHYGFTRTKLGECVAAFREAGGDAMEVVTGLQGAATTALLARLCAGHGLLASCGSDYHESRPGGAEPGGFDPLPPSCVPVWQAWNGSE